MNFEDKTTKQKILVHYWRPETNERVVEETDGYFEHGKFLDHVWSEGNFACDCNRSLFMYKYDETKELPCSGRGDRKILIEKICLASNRNVVLYEEVFLLASTSIGLTRHDDESDEDFANRVTDSLK